VLRVEEHAPGANITTAGDALWYTIVTISTVGYGDQYPVTQLGRIIGSVIIVVGVGIFGTFTGYLATVFLGSNDSETQADATIGETGVKPAGLPLEPATSAESVAQLRILLERSEANLAEMRQLIQGGSDPR
jgi:voltage-gated potassium channel